MTKELHILKTIIISLFILLISTVTFGTPIINYGESLEYYAPHHSELGHPGTETHYFAETGDDHHFAWLDQNLLTPVIDVFYDFRSVGGFANLITPGQKARAIDAFNLWSSVSNLNFIQNTIVSDSAIINVGTGDLAALGSFTSGPGETLGLGGGDFTHHGKIPHNITGGVAWMDFSDTWDETIGNGNPSGTFDYFTVAVQEIGHALGLGHVNDLSGPDMMDGYYVAEQVTLSINDISHITSIYGELSVAAVPEPATIALLGIGLVGLGGSYLRRRRKRF